MMHSEVTQNQLNWTSYVPNIMMNTWTNNLMNPHNSVFRSLQVERSEKDYDQADKIWNYLIQALLYPNCFII